MKKLLFIISIFIILNIIHCNNLEADLFNTDQFIKNQLENLGNYTSIFSLHPILKKINILIFGEVGSGKSSFINYLYKILNQNDLEDAKIATTGSIGDSITKSFSKYKIHERLFIYDIPGFDTSTFENNYLWKAKYTIDGYWNNGESYFENNYSFFKQENFDAILFLIPMNKKFPKEPEKKIREYALSRNSI
jgi:ribosome biogenesis GTPase A